MSPLITNRLPTRATLAALLAAAALVTPTRLVADVREIALVDHAAVRAACTEAQSDGPRRLYSVTVPSGAWRFLPYDAEQGVLGIDMRRNLRALRGSLELIASRLETAGFVADAERAVALEVAARDGSFGLRVGFFLGFDNRSRTLCVLRPTVGVTTARVDLAYVELVDGNGERVLREDTERLRAFSDDAERSSIPGEGPRAAVGDARVLRGAALNATQRRALADAQGALRTAVGRCFADAITRGAPHEAQMIVRVTIDPVSGGVTNAEPELSPVGDGTASTCVGEAFRTTVRLAPSAPSAAILLEVPIRFVSE